MKLKLKSATLKKVAALAAAVTIAGFVAPSPASASATKTKAASPMWTRVGCYGPFVTWPVKIVHYGWTDQCFQFHGGETLYSNDYYDEVWSGSYRIIVYYQGHAPDSLNPEQKDVVPGGLLQKIVVIG